MRTKQPASFGTLRTLDKAVWEELQNYNTTKVCTCAAAADILKEREDDRVHQFLFGLDLPRFSNIWSTITGEDPLPPLNQVYSRVVREEKNQNISQTQENSKTEGISFSVKIESPQVCRSFWTEIWESFQSLLHSLSLIRLCGARMLPLAWLP